MPQQTIPVVDLQDYLKGSQGAKEKFVATLGDALKDIGFFALQGHGVDHRLIEKAYQLAEGFFRFTHSEKKKYEDLAIKGQRGYTILVVSTPRIPKPQT